MHQTSNKKLTKPFKKLLFIVFILFSGFVLPTKVAFAQDCSNINYEDPSIVDLMCPFIGFLNIIVVSAGVVFAGVILVASIKFATSQGDPKAAMGAKATITYAVIGVASVVGVYVILNIAGGIFGFNRNLTGSGVLDVVQETICDFLNDPNTEGGPIVSVNGGC